MGINRRRTNDTFRGGELVAEVTLRIVVDPGRVRACTGRAVFRGLGRRRALRGLRAGARRRADEWKRGTKLAQHEIAPSRCAALFGNAPAANSVPIAWNRNGAFTAPLTQ